MGLLFPGNTDYEQSEPAQWIPGGRDLDRLIVPYRGDVDQLDAFVATLEQWQASTIDTNMFLESWPNDGHKQFPTVSLTYIGCKGGNTDPKTREDSSSTVQAASYSDPDAPTTTIDITYVSYSSTKHTITRQRPEGVIGAITPADVVGVWYTARDIPILPPIGASSEERTAFIIETYFYQRLVVMPASIELVPGQYYGNSETAVHMLFDAGT